MRMLFFTHSGLRYLILLIGLISMVYSAWALATKQKNDRPGRVLGSIFVGLVDLQLLFGILMVALGNYYPALIGHMVMMLGAAVVAHGAMMMAKTTEPVEKRAGLRLAGVLIALILIAGGVMAIGRSLFSTGVPSITS
jgi:heme A synthase